MSLSVLPEPQKVPAVNFREIDTYVFDYGGVVSDHHCEPWQGNLSKLLGAPDKVVNSLLSETSDWGRDYRLGKMERNVFWNLIVEKTGVHDVNFSELEYNWAQSYQLNSQMMELVHFLREDLGAQVGIMSNSDKYRHEHIERTYALSKKFDFFVSSHLNGVVKPEKEAYLATLEVANRLNSPHSVVYIDDRERNVLPAISVGMCGYVFETPDTLIKDLAKQGIVFPAKPKNVLLKEAQNPHHFG